MVHNTYDAEDITQEVFIKLFQNLYTLKNPETFRAWLRMITVNACKDFLRKKGKIITETYDADVQDKEAAVSTDNGTYTEFVPHENTEQKDNDRIIYDIISAMPENYSRILIMRFYGDMSYLELSESLGVGIGTVKSRLSYAKGKLKEKIENYETKHDIRLHTTDVFEHLTEIIHRSSQWIQVPTHVCDAVGSNISTYVNTVTGSGNAAPTVTAISSARNTASVITNAASAGLSGAVSTTISNAVATKVSAVVAAASVAACIGIV